MATIVTVDKAGRILLPKEMRDAERMQPGMKFLLIKGRNGAIWLQRLDPEEIVRRIKEELKDIDLKSIIEKIK